MRSRSAAADGVVTAAGFADRVEQAVDLFQDGAAGDDIAIVVVRIHD